MADGQLPKNPIHMTRDRFACPTTARETRIGADEPAPGADAETATGATLTRASTVQDAVVGAYGAALAEATGLTAPTALAGACHATRGVAGVRATL